MKGQTCSAFLVVLALVGTSWGAGSTRWQMIIYVDAAATGAGNGSSWDDAYTSVQPALNAAIGGKQVWVAAGRYVGTITLKKGVGLYGGFAGVEDPATFDLADRDFVANETILDGNEAGCVVTAPAGATAATRIDGFTITKGIGQLSASTRWGGGLYLNGSSPTVANNRITGNSASSGGGICLTSCSPTITNNTIAGNSSSSMGGGLLLFESPATISRNTIAGNSASASSGGGLYVRDSSATIANNVIRGNSANSGGGLWVIGDDSPTIVGNTIVGNNASSGGGLDLYFCSPTIANTTVAFNSSGIQWLGDNGPVLRHNCVYGNTRYNYSGVTDPTGTYGNISVDPLFVLYPDDLHMQPGSPSVDAGSNGLAVGGVDLGGEARIVDGDEDEIAVVDMGAYEYHPVRLPCDLDSSGEVDGLDYALFRAAFGRSVGQAGYNARCDYDGSGTVGLKDYQAWLGCYREFIGNPLAGPPPLPVPVPTPTPGPGPGPQPVTDVGGDVREGAAQSPVRGGMGRP